METVAAVGLEAVSEDALRTRFIENWCKVLKVSEHSKPLVGLSFWTFPFVLGLRRNGMLIRVSWDQVPPPEPGNPWYRRVSEDSWGSVAYVSQTPASRTHVCADPGGSSPVKYDLSEVEQDLSEAVTTYVKEDVDKANAIEARGEMVVVDSSSGLHSWPFSEGSPHPRKTSAARCSAVENVLRNDLSNSKPSPIAQFRSSLLSIGTSLLMNLGTST
ncbi:MAG: hypothetical protein QGD89_09470 [Actinomycetota bacterium]|nr:hypothetical protein [Actinomycetota bacterium]